MSGVELDLNLLNNKSLFQKIKEQTDLIENLFVHLANDFPQSELLQHHPNSKGTKISKGYNLENAPYQVLDLLRDFDVNSGFNIRVLNWWGRGLYIFVFFGKLTHQEKFLTIRHLKNSYHNCNHPSPWAYEEIIANHRPNAVFRAEYDPRISDFFQIFKQVELSAEFSKTQLTLKKEIRFILDNPY